MAVLRSRAIVAKNNEFIEQIKKDSNIQSGDSVCGADDDEFELFYDTDPYAFEDYKIKSNDGLSQMVKDFFNL